MHLLKLFPSHSHGKTPLAQINLNQSLFVGMEIPHPSISDANKNSLWHTPLYFLEKYQKEVYSVHILRTKECLTC